MHDKVSVVDLALVFFQEILFREQNLLLCKLLLFLDQIWGGGEGAEVSEGKKARLQTVLCDYQIL